MFSKQISHVSSYKQTEISWLGSQGQLNVGIRENSDLEGTGPSFDPLLLSLMNFKMAVFLFLPVCFFPSLPSFFLCLFLF